MSRIGGMVERMRALFWRSTADRRMDEEIRFHLEMETERNIRLGMSPVEARRLAMVAFGGVEKHREEMRDGRRLRLVEDLGRDVSYAARVLSRSPGFTAAAVLCLALGIGLNTAVFSIISALNLRPLPFANPSELVAIHAVRGDHGGTGGVSPADIEEIRLQVPALAAVAGYAPVAVNLAGGNEPERVSGASVTADLFGLLGARTLMGRGFVAEEEGAAGLNVVVLGEDLWASRFGARPDILGQEVQINGQPRRVVGVMPAGFRFPETARLWIPVSMDANDSRGTRGLLAIGRLGAGATLPVARSQLAAVAERLRLEHPDSHTGWSLGVDSFRDRILSPQRRQMLYMMLGAVGFVLLIACANAANLMLARNATRQRELAIRMALGANRRRVVRQLLTEAVLIALAAGVIGVLIAAGWLRLMVARVPMELPMFARMEVDGRALAFAVVVSVLTAVVFGLLPALRASRTDVRGMAGDGGRTVGSADPGSSRLRDGLVTTQVAMSLLLLIAATLLTRSAIAATQADVGFQTRDLLTLRTSLVGERYDEMEVRSEAFLQMVARLESLPGVRSATAVTEIPGDRGGVLTRVLPEPAEGQPGDEFPARWVASTPGLFTTLRQPLLAGSDFSTTQAADVTGTTVILSSSLVQRLWPGVSPGEALDRRIKLPDVDEAAWFEVVGVAPDLHYHAVGEMEPNSNLQVHLPYARGGWRLMSLLLRTSGHPLAVIPGVRGEIRALDPTLALFGMQTMEEYMAYSNWERRMSGEVFASFGLMALVLALIGVYGVASFAVTQRSREIGVRMALGARQRDVLRLVLGRSVRVVAIGVALGVPAALGAAMVLRGLLHGVRPLDPVSFVMVPLALAGAAMIASLLPIRRAARIDPCVTLRED